MKVVEKMWVRWRRVVTWGNVAVVVAGTGTADGGSGGGRRLAATVDVVGMRGHLWKESSWVVV